MMLKYDSCSSGVSSSSPFSYTNRFANITDFINFRKKLNTLFVKWTKFTKTNFDSSQINFEHCFCAKGVDME